MDNISGLITNTPLFIEASAPPTTPPPPSDIEKIALKAIQAPSTSKSTRILTPPIERVSTNSLTEIIKIFRFALSNKNLIKYIDHPIEDFFKALKRTKKSPNIHIFVPSFEGSFLDLLRLKMKEDPILKPFSLYFEHIESIPLAPGYQNIFELLLHVLLRPSIIKVAPEESPELTMELEASFYSIYPFICNPQKNLSELGLQGLVKKFVTEIKPLKNLDTEYSNEFMRCKELLSILQDASLLESDIEWLIEKIFLSTPSFIRPQRLFFYDLKENAAHSFFRFVFLLMQRPIVNFQGYFIHLNAFSYVKLSKSTQPSTETPKHLTEFKTNTTKSRIKKSTQSTIDCIRTWEKIPIPEKADQFAPIIENFLKSIHPTKTNITPLYILKDFEEFIIEFNNSYFIIEYLSKYLINASLNYGKAFTDEISTEDLIALFKEEIDVISIPDKTPITESSLPSIEPEKKSSPSLAIDPTPPRPQPILEILSRNLCNKEVHLHLLFALEKFSKIEESSVENCPLLLKEILLDCCIAIEKTLSLHKKPEMEDQIPSHNFDTLRAQSTLKFEGKLLNFLKNNASGILMARYPYMHSNQKSIGSILISDKPLGEKISAIHDCMRKTLAIVFPSILIEEIALPRTPKKSLSLPSPQSPLKDLSNALIRNKTIRNHGFCHLKAKHIHAEVELLEIALHLETIEEFDPLQFFQTLLKIGKLYEECFHLMLIMHDVKTLNESYPHQRHDLVWLFDQVGLKDFTIRNSLSQINLMNTAHYLTYTLTGPNSRAAKQAWRDFQSLIADKRVKLEIGDESFTLAGSSTAAPDLSHYEEIRRHLLAYLPTLLSQMP